MFAISIALYVCLVRATEEYQDAELQKSASSSNGFKLSGFVIALIVSALSVVAMLALWDCHRRRKKEEKEKKRVEDEQIKWFEKQKEQMKTPVRTTVLKVHCAAVPVARFRGKPHNVPTKVPAIDLDAGSEISEFEFPEDKEDDLGSECKPRLRSKKLPISSISRQDSTDNKPYLEIDIRHSLRNLECSVISLDMKETEATVEYSRRSTL